MTIVSIIICENRGEDSTFDMYVDYDLGGTNCYLIQGEPVASRKTFVWNDKFAITATDKLHFLGLAAGGDAGFDVWCTYIDQQFAAP